MTYAQPNAIKRLYFAVMLLGVLATASCRKEMLIGAYPGNGTTASVNYYGVSQTFPLYNPINSTYGGTGIFVDTAENNKGAINSQSFPGAPFFEFNGDVTQRMYPITGDNQPVYMDYKAGSHRFIFSYMIALGTSRLVNQPVVRLADTSFSIAAGSHSCLYLTDGPAPENAAATYAVVRTDQPLNHAIQPGKVSVRFVHLSADAGKLTFKLLKADGTESGTGALQELPFGQSSAYLALEPTDAQDGQLIFRVYNNAGKLLLTTGLQAASGHSFEILIHGMVNRHLRRIVTDVSATGAPVYKTVTLPVSLAATLRQTY